MKTTKWLSDKRVIYSLLSIGVIALIAINFWGWFFMKRIEAQAFQQLVDQSKKNGKIYALLIQERFTSEELLTLSESNIQQIALQNLLYEFQQTANLATIFVSSLDQSVFYSSELDPQKNENIQNFALNDSLFDSAMIENQPNAELRALSGNYFLTTYIPLVDELETPIAILVFEAPAALFDRLSLFQSAMVYLGIGGLIIILGFAGIILLSIWRLFGLEGQLHQQTRLAQLGQMAAMVAHEIRNPLSIIKGSAQVLRKKYASESDEMFDFIPEEINRLNRLVNDFLQFAKKRELKLIGTNVHPIIENLAKQTADPRVKTQLNASSAQIKIDEDAFKQILINIVENARKSTDDSGEIYIITTRLSKVLEVVVKDTGEGMSAETLKKIYEPFYSTRATGSGLGMAITHQLLTQMNAKIHITSQLKHGTTVKLTFPL